MTYNNNNTNSNTSTSTNTNNNIQTGDMTNRNINTSTSTAVNTNQNNNVNTSTSTSTSSNVNTNNNINTGDQTVRTVQSGGTNNVNTNNNTNSSTSSNTNVNNNIQTGDMTNRNINDTKITQTIKQPPPTAVAPAMMSMGQDLCVTGVSGAAQTQIIGMSFGTTQRDFNCERLRLSKTLYDMGMKVAAVATMCQDRRIWDAMMAAGTPCPIEGKIGDQAREFWERNPHLIPNPVEAVQIVEESYQDRTRNRR
jgi:hypothetical protein